MFVLDSQLDGLFCHITVVWGFIPKMKWLSLVIPQKKNDKYLLQTGRAKTEPKNT